MRKYNIKAIFGVMTDVLFILITLVILILSFLKPSHNQLPSQIIPLTLVAGVLMLIFFAFLRFLCGKFPFLTTTKCFVILSILYGILLIIVSVTNRNSPASFYDYNVCYRSAHEYATTGSVTDPMYFSMNPHNWKCTLILSWLMKAAYALGMSDPFAFILIANLVIIFSALYSGRYLLSAFFPEEKHLALMLLVCFATCLPIYAYVQAFYSDGASFGGAVTGMALAHYAFTKVKRKPLKVSVLFAAGAVFAFGALMKITSLIAVIAMIICYLFIHDRSDRMTDERSARSSSLKTGLISVCIIIIGFITIYTISESVCNRDYWYADGKIYNGPAISYIAMGLKGDGTYIENSDFRNTLDGLIYSEAKKEYSLEYIRENASYFVDPDHLTGKIRANYASGGLGAWDFAYYGYEGDTLLSRIFNPYGDLYWNGSKYCMIWQLQIYAVMLIGCIINLLDRKGKNNSALLRITELTFIGYFLFLLIWEANNRQLYNMLPVLLVGYVISLKRVHK